MPWVIFGLIMVMVVLMGRLIGVSANEAGSSARWIAQPAPERFVARTQLANLVNSTPNFSDPALAVSLFAGAWTTNATIDWELTSGDPLISAAAANIVPPPPLPMQMPFQQTSSETTTNQLIIKYRRESAAFTRAQSLDQLTRLGVSIGMRLNYRRQMSNDSHVLALPAELKLSDVEKITDLFKKMPEVELAEPDRRIQHTLNTNDPYYTSNSLWGLNGTYGVNAPTAWDLTTGSPSVVVAVIDTGIASHSDLNANVLPGYDFISDPCNANDGTGRDADASDSGDWFNNGDCGFTGSSSGSSWHGTHVAGTIAGIGNNSTGVVGVAMNARILPIRVLGKVGGYTSDIADGMRWAAGLAVTGVPNNPNPAKVLNLSLGGSGVCTSGSTFQTAVNAVVAAGAVVVVAAGNSNVDAAGASPASCAGVITVASTTSTGDRSSFSNFGSTVEISAPGSSIWSTVNAGSTSPAGESYAPYSGTSMATPHVAGVVALLFSMNSGLTPAQVVSTLQASATAFPSGSSCNTSICGPGIVNAYSALGGVNLPSVSMAVSPSSVQEDGATNLVYTLTRTSNNLSSALTVNFTTGGTADAAAISGSPADYSVTGTNATFNSSTRTGTATFAAGATTTQLTVDPIADALAENANETVIVGIASGSGYLMGSPSSATGTIVSEEVVPGNTTAITIPSVGVANPYPSNVTISGLGEITTRVRVRLNAMNHTWPDDIDILLVGPTGARTILMSDVGGDTDISNVTLTFDSAATASLPDRTAISSGTYLPTNIEANDAGVAATDSFSSPAPAGPYTASFAPFIGANPNGVWSLYVVDDTSSDSGGIINGWSLEVNTAAPVGVGIYDDGNSNWVYGGAWASSSGMAGPYNGTLSMSSDLNATARIYINGTAFRLRYTRNQNRGVLGVYVDGAKVADIYANTSSLGWQTVYQRTGLSSGVHLIEIRHGGGAAGSIIDIDALEVYAPPTPTPLGVGVYDDWHENWAHTGTWGVYSGYAGPHNGTLTASSDTNARASIQINGSAFRLRYTRNPFRGTFGIYVDGSKVADVNAYNSSLSWQSIFQKADLSNGVHTIEVRHGGGAVGSVIDIDALEVYVPVVPTPLGPGIYDDTHANWSYTGNWTNASSLTGPHNRTLAHTTDLTATASIQINGTAFRLRYTRNQNRGTIGVYVDGSKVADVNAISSSLSWQTVYELTGLSSGVHTIELRHGGGAAGSIIDIDAVEVFVPPTPLGVGVYDDTHANWVYSGTWNSLSGQSGPHNGTLRTSADVLATAVIEINGTAFRLRYSRGTNRGIFEIYVDGIKVAEVNANSSGQSWQAIYQRTGLTTGVHTIEIKHAGRPTGTIIDIDALEVYVPVAPVPLVAGVYDDIHANWTYTGSWTNASNLRGPHNGTLAHTTDLSARASIQINGTAFRLRYTRNQNRGTIGVYVDGSKVADVNAMAGSLSWQAVYELTGLSSGVHTIEVRHGGGASGSIVDIDAIEVFVPPAPVGIGVYDDQHANWTFNGSWITAAGLNGPHNGTLKHSTDLFARASIQINGTAFRLRYTKNQYRGIIAVYVDGIKVADINAFNASLNWQAVFDRTGLASGIHTIEIRHGGGAGTIIDIDAIEVYVPTTGSRN